jgi:NDP-sugar pyrophosphorylase family protein
LESDYLKRKISITINEKTLKHVSSLVDGIRISGTSQAIEYLLEKALADQRPAIIMATTPQKKYHGVDFEERPLLKVNGKTLIEHAIEKLSESKFKKIFIVGGHKILTKIYSIVGDGSAFGVEIKYSEEEASSGGLGLKKIRDLINSSFLVVFCDIYFSNFNLEELWKQHTRFGGISTLLLNTIPPAYVHKEIVAKIKGHQIIEIKNVEKNNFLPYFSGVFVAEPEFISLPEKLKDVFPNLSKKGLLNGYVESTPYFHLHTLKEAKRILK